MVRMRWNAPSATTQPDFTQANEQTEDDEKLMRDDRT